MVKKEKPVIGIIGGIGSGKSTVAKMLQGVKGRVFHADENAHELLQTPEIIEILATHFGPKIINQEGKIDRQTLGKFVFENKEELTFLENVLHPKVREKALAFIEFCQISIDCSHIVLDIPLLLEKNWRNLCNAMVFVNCKDEERRNRVRARGWDAKELEIRENSQFPLTTKVSISDYIIDNSADLDQTRQQAVDLLKKILP